MRKYQKKTIEFYDKNVKEYKKNTDPLMNPEWLKKFTKYLPSKGRILDAGCAYGRDCDFFVKKEFDTYGIDLSEEMIKKAKKSINNCKFSVMDVLHLDFEDSFFDGIWSSATLLHLKKEDARKALAEFNRVLKKKGLLYLDMKEGEGEETLKDPRYSKTEKFYSYFREAELKELLKERGFEIADHVCSSKATKYHYTKVIYLIAKKAHSSTN